jgi:hypothetical protein
MKQKLVLIIAPLVFTIAGFWGIGAEVATASNACFSTHSLGPGESICISDHGNIVKVESPAGFEQIGQLNLFRDGYAICPGSPPNPVNGGYDTGGAEAGFGPPTIIQPNGPNTLPLTIIRDTTSGIYRLEQKLVKKNVDKAEKDVVITMKVKRLSTADCIPDCASVPVRLQRAFEGDVDNNTGPNSRFARTKDSVWEWVENVPVDRPEGHGLMLENLSFGVDHAPVVHTVANYNPTGAGLQTGKGCIVFAGQEITPTAPGTGNNLVGRMIYGLSLPSVGSSETRTVLYRRF